MGREVRILCDKCGADVYGKEYYTLPISRVNHGKISKLPTIWLCKDCMLKTNIFIATSDDQKKED